METNKLINALSYFSLFFAPFLFPIIVYVVSNDEEVKYHAKRAFISHIIPVLSVFVLLFVFGVTIFVDPASSLIVIGLFFFVGVVDFILLVWNVFQGVKVLVQ